MRTRSSWIWCWIIGAALAAGAGAQQYTTIIDNLPTCTGNRNGRIIAVSDATSDSDCTEGGATGEDRFVHPCICDTLNALGPYWKAVGGGAGVTGLTSCADGTALADNALMRADGTTKCQGSTVTVADSTGNLQWEGATADAFEGNFTFADPTADWTWAWGAAGDLVGAGSLSIDNLKLDGNTISSTDTNGNIVLAPNGTGQITFPNGSETKPAIALAESATKGISFSQNSQGNFAWVDSNQVRLFIGPQETRTQADNFYGWTSSTSDGGGATINDTALGRAAAGIVSVNDGTASGGAALHLNPLASPPRTCDATAEGDLYSDTSHALCWCDASAWQKLSGAGTCA